MPRQDLLHFARLAYRLAAYVLPPYSSPFGPKKFTQPSLLASAAELRVALADASDPHRPCSVVFRQSACQTLSEGGKVPDTFARRARNCDGCVTHGAGRRRPGG